MADRADGGEWAFVSNMFPSFKDASYGSFVQRSLEDLVSEQLRISETVLIYGRRTGLGKFVAYAIYYSKLLSLLTRKDIPNWYVHYASHHCILLVIAAELFGKAIVVNIHGDDLTLAKSNLYRRLMSVGQTRILSKAKLVIVPSLFFKELVLGRFPEVDEGRIFVSPSSGVDVEALSGIESSRSTYWTCSSDVRIAEIGFVGRIDPDKGWETLYDAFTSLPKQITSRARLHYWGAGAEEKRLRSRISEQNSGTIIYHGPFGYDALPNVLSQFDFHVVPSARESLGLSALEALAAGHILICSSIRPFTDLTKHGVSAIHFEAFDADSLRDAIAQTLMLPNETLSAMVGAGREISWKYDRSDVAAALARHIHRLAQ